MAALTEKDLEQKRAKVVKLREQIADAEAKAAAVVQENNDAIQGAQLDAEAARLEARLAQAREAAKVANVREGASGPLEAIQAQQESAEAQQQAQAESTSQEQQNAEATNADQNQEV